MDLPNKIDENVECDELYRELAQLDRPIFRYSQFLGSKQSITHKIWKESFKFIDPITRIPTVITLTNSSASLDDCERNLFLKIKNLFDFSRGIAAIRSNKLSDYEDSGENPNVHSKESYVEQNINVSVIPADNLIIILGNEQLTHDIAESATELTKQWIETVTKEQNINNCPIGIYFTICEKNKISYLSKNLKPFTDNSSIKIDLSLYGFTVKKANKDLSVVPELEDVKFHILTSSTKLGNQKNIRRSDNLKMQHESNGYNVPLTYFLRMMNSDGIREFLKHCRHVMARNMKRTREESETSEMIGDSNKENVTSTEQDASKRKRKPLESLNL